LGSARIATGDYLGAASLLEQALTVYRDLHDPLGEASALHNQGRVHAAAGNYSAAASLLEQALTRYGHLGNRHAMAGSLHHLGRVLAAAGDYPAAASLLEQALAVYRDFGDRHAEAGVLNSIAELLTVPAGPYGGLTAARGPWPQPPGCTDGDAGGCRARGRAPVAQGHEPAGAG
jgi:tetratricopeptide (TPR) repeat protein